MIQRKVNEGKWWTIISTECWLQDNCDGCRYEKYCVRISQDKPILKQVVDILLDKYGEPPAFLIEKIDKIIYYDNN